MELASLLAAVLAAPEDDKPRLAYADAVEGSDPALASFIRLQCEAALPTTLRSRARELEAQAEILSKANQSRWVGAEIEQLDEAVFERGFLRGVFASPLHSLEALAAILERHKSLHLTVADFDALDVMDEPDEEVCAGLSGWAACPQLQTVHRLGQEEDALTASGWRILLGSPHLKNLRELVIGDQDCTKEVMAVVASADHLKLRQISCFGFITASLGDQGLAAIAGAPHLASLRDLHLWNCQIGGEGMGALANSPHINKLESLQLGSGQYTLNNIGEEGASALADSSNFEELQKLNLNFNKIGDVGAVAILESERLPRLRELSLQATQISGATARAFCSLAERCPQLEHVDLSHNAIDGDGGVWAIVRSPLFRQLRSLTLYHNHVDDAGVAEIVRSLDRYDCQLKELYLAQNPISEAGLDLLLQADLKQLRWLGLGLIQISDQKRRALREVYGDRVHF